MSSFLYCIHCGNEIKGKSYELLNGKLCEQCALKSKTPFWKLHFMNYEELFPLRKSKRAILFSCFAFSVSVLGLFLYFF